MEPERREIVVPRGLVVTLAIGGVGCAVYWLRDVLAPLFLAFLIAYVLDPVVDRLERRGLPRAAATGLTVALALAAVPALALLVIPGVAREVSQVVAELPAKLAGLEERLEPTLASWGIAIPHTGDEWIAELRKHSELGKSLATPVSTALGWLASGTVSALSAVVGALVVPVFAVYLLNDFDRITSGTANLVPRRWRPIVRQYAGEIDAILGQFLRGQVLVMLLLAILYSTAYAIIGVKLAIPIGVVAGILNFVPYVGSAFALLAGTFMTLLGGGGLAQVLAVAGAYTVIQTLEGFVITPRIVGKTVGLPEAWVLVALFVGGELFGFTGVLLAVPVAAVAKIFVQHGLEHYQSTSLYLERSTLEPPSVAPSARDEAVAPVEGAAGATPAAAPLAEASLPPPSDEPATTARAGDTGSAGPSGEPERSVGGDG
ncbi:MAG: AI-2E family transporter [Polyangiaceae bacterium]|nr:AI-2E family transporter [Polyangiaceae bacterium]